MLEFEKAWRLLPIWVVLGTVGIFGTCLLLLCNLASVIDSHYYFFIIWHLSF